MNVSLPFWLIRRLVKHNPWLLAQNGVVNKQMMTIPLWLVAIKLHGAITLTDKQRERLAREGLA